MVREFYRLNTGFFLLIITLTFGFMSGVEHRALAEMFVSSPQLLLLPIIVWLIYLLKIINFNNQRMAVAENGFLFEMRVMPQGRQFASTAVAITVQFVPALAYGTFLIIISVRNQAYFSIAQIIVSLLVLVIAGIIAFLFKIKNPYREVNITALKKFLDYTFTRTLPQFFIEWTLRREPLLCIGTKIFTCVLIFAVSNLYLAETFDSRLMAMTSVIAFAGNMMIINELHRFENFHFIQLRNAAYALPKRILLMLVVLTILSIPEIVFLFRFFPKHMSIVTYAEIVFLGIGLMLLLYSLIFLNLHKENFPRSIFGIVITSIFLLLCKVPVGLLAIVNIISAVVIYHQRYYTFEYNAEDFD